MDSAAVETVEGSVELSVVYQGVVHPGGEAVVEATEERAVVDAAVATLEMEVD